MNHHGSYDSDGIPHPINPNSGVSTILYIYEYDLPMGTIMAVVTVLEIHMERNMVGSMKPSINSRGLVPTRTAD